MQDYILGIVRHLLTSAAGGLIAHGYLTTDQSQQIIGGLIAIIGVAWSLYQKYEQQQAAKAAQQASQPASKK